MALSNCEKCWDTPCTCGYGYKSHPTYSDPQNMASFIDDILGYRTKEELEIILQLLNEKIPSKIAALEEENQKGLGKM